jgi:hypothetical protein
MSRVTGNATLPGTNRPTKVSNPLVKSISLSTLLCAMVVSPSVLGQQRTGFRLPQGASDKFGETTITALITKSATFNGKRVRVFASFHSDGIERSVLMEPNCGEPETPSANEPQCRRGVVPTESDKAEKDPGNQSLDRALAQGNRGTMDKQITAAFTGIFRCVPSCASPKYFTLEIERVENLSVEIKDLKPHLPKMK